MKSNETKKRKSGFNPNRTCYLTADGKYYQTTMHLARKMLDEGIITEEEYRQIDTIFLEKYKPVFGTLLSDISLTSGA